MFGRKNIKEKKHWLKIEFKKNIQKAENIAKQDIQKAEETIKKDANIVKEDIKQLGTKDNFSFFMTYGWAITVIIICLAGFVWWQFFNIKLETCEFVDGSGLFCENFDVTNSSLVFEIRNLNNKSITIDQITIESCSINPNQNIQDNDKKRFDIPCNISSGRLSEQVIVAYKIEDFQKHIVAKIRKIVP